MKYRTVGKTGITGENLIPCCLQLGRWQIAKIWEFRPKKV